MFYAIFLTMAHVHLLHVRFHDVGKCRLVLDGTGAGMSISDGQFKRLPVEVGPELPTPKPRDRIYIPRSVHTRPLLAKLDVYVIFLYLNIRLW